MDPSFRMLPVTALSKRLMVSLVQHADAGDDLVADEMDVELVGAVWLEVLRQLPALLDSFAGARVERPVKDSDLLRDLVGGYCHETSASSSSSAGFGWASPRSVAARRGRAALQPAAPLRGREPGHQLRAVERALGWVWASAGLAHKWPNQLWGWPQMHEAAGRGLRAHQKHQLHQVCQVCQAVGLDRLDLNAVVGWLGTNVFFTRRQSTDEYLSVSIRVIPCAGHRLQESSANYSCAQLWQYSVGLPV